MKAAYKAFAMAAIAAAFIAGLIVASGDPSERSVPPAGPGPDTQTMLITASTRAQDSITIVDYVVQGPGISDVVEIAAATPSSDLFIATLSIDSSQFATVLIENATITHMTRTDNVFEGMSLLSTGGAAPLIPFPTRGAIFEPDVRADGTIDRIVVTTDGLAGNIGTLTLQRVLGRGRLWIHDVTIGELIVTNSEIGDGTGIDSASFVVAASVIRGTGNTDSGNIEQPRDFR